MKSLIIEKIDSKRSGLALELSLRVFLECNSGDYNEEGIQLFNRFINDKNSIKALTMYGAFIDGILVGILGSKNNGSHISLYFVEKEYQGYGIGRKLFDALIEDTKAKHITVSASTIAVKVYEKLGFKQTAAPETNHGLISVPMEYRNVL
ncbi:MAG: GNAT family N-acetyltransferase [Proteiniphilum sp.]|uniref:GNAT family N-acetyltransferase n=1 Tax=Proteiniphilum sp. TaxID=1926877 RepID=UPI002B20B3AC|nr:GNAT family N-acetyltransferase [Proteiniphilum sp.]MEA5126642.1 GNAT family N-acetyltransferase [Proteiniphilum sp.]